MNIAEIRQQYPQYNDMSDEQLGSAISKKMASKAAPPKSDKFQNPLPFGSSFGDSIVPAIAGIGPGVHDAGRGLMQLLKKGGEWSGLLSPGAEQEYTQKADMARQLEKEKYSQAWPDSEAALGVGKFAGEMLPYLLAPQLGARTLARKIAGGVATGTAIGGAQYVPEGDSRMSNMITGGLIGGGIPAVGAAITSAPAKAIGGGILSLGEKALKHLLPNKFENLIAKDLMTGIDAKKALKTKKEADKLGINITPAEASGSETAINAQRALGTSKGGQEALSAFQRERGAQERNSIDKLMKEISPTKKDASGEIRKAADETIKKQMAERKRVSEPFYNAIKGDSVPEKELSSLAKEYPVIKQAYKEVLTNKAFVPRLREYKNAKNLQASTAEKQSSEGLDSLHQAYNEISKEALKKKEKKPLLNQLPVVDLVKRRLDDKIAKLKGDRQTTEASLYREAKNKLVSLADKSSPSYSLARGMFSGESAELAKLKGSDIKRLADLPDHQLQQVSKILFDRNETNPKVLNKLRDTFIKEDPNAWKQIIRNEMDRRLSHMEHGTTGSKFYDGILAKDADFNQFLSATKGMPGVQKKLIAMRPVFKNLINNIRDKNIISNEASVQSLGKELGKAGSKAAMSAYDKKAIEIITSGKWDKYLTNISKTKDKTDRAVKLGKLLGMKVDRAATLVATRPGTPEKKREEYK